MGHRANYVIIRDGEAKAFEDQWGAMGAIYAFADGPEIAAKLAEGEADATSELMDWAFAEGGYLIDFDRKRAISFGMPMMGDVFDFSEESDESGNEGVAEAAALDDALENGSLEFLKLIAPKWPGWLLCWNDRGVDAFADYLRQQGHTNITCQKPDADPEDPDIAEWQA